LAETLPPVDVDLLRTRLSVHGDVSPGPRAADLTVTLRGPAAVPAAVQDLAGAGFGLGTLVATDEERVTGDLKVRYLFEPVTGHLPLPDVFVTLVASLDPGHPEVPSISVITPAANWHEREAHDLLGVVFTGHPDPRPLVVHDGWPPGVFPLRKGFDGSQRLPVEPAPEVPHLHVEGEGVFEIPVGPIHAGIIEPGHFRFSSIGEVVLCLDARLFYTHRGLEKRMEGLSVTDASHVAERICGVCAFSHGLGFCEAAEQVGGVQVPDRARALRTVGLELERLYNHVGDIGNIAAGGSYHFGNSAGLRIKEPLQQLNERLSGSRFLRGLVLPGGVRQDLTRTLVCDIETTLERTVTDLDFLVDRVESNPSVLDRMDTTGVVPRKDAVALGLTGVGARASSVDRDSRRDHPHAAYGKDPALAVRVSTETEGDVHARLLVRVAEARESVRLLLVLLGGLPSGPVAVPFPAALPGWAVGLSTVETPRGAAIQWLRVDQEGRVDRYHLRSASYANWPALPLAALTAIVPDFPIVNKSFELCYACTDR
jgi:Ni,Fe-hydrogenase III large subunit/Ni,Fe-hydrogenase III component G